MEVFSPLASLRIILYNTPLMNLQLEKYPFAEALVRLVYPASCTLCNVLLELDQRHVCPACLEKIGSLKYGLDQCLDPRRFKSLENVWSVFSYQDEVKEILTRIKFSRKPWLLSIFEQDLASLSSLACAETGYHRLVPIPMDAVKLMEREFNPPHLIAEILSQSSGIPCRTRTLAKHRTSIPQSHLDREERAINPYGVFEIRDRSVRGEKILLIDDILTTGATAQEAARILKEAGAVQVDLLTLARTP